MTNILNWHDELNIIKTRLLEGQDNNKQRVIQRLEVYKKILSDGEINFEVNQPAHEDLLRIGLLVNRNSKLQIANPIYRVCFDENWVNEKLILIINNQSITVATENSPEANIPHPNPQEPETMQPNKQPKSKNPNKVLSLIRQIINTYIISPLKFLRPVWENFLASTSHYLILPIVAIVAILYNFCRLHYQDIFNFIKNKIKYIIVTICILGLISFIIITQIHINPIDPKLIAQIDQDVDKSTKKFNTEQIEGLKLALTAGQKLEEIRKKQNLNKITDYPTVKPIYALHKIENEIYQSNQIDGIPKEVRIILFSPAGDKIAFAEDKSLHIYDFSETGTYQSPKQKDFAYIITSFNFSEDGELIAVGLQNGEIQLLDKSLKMLDSKRNAHTQEISSVSFSKDKQKLLTTGQDGMVSLWDISNRKFTSPPVFSKEHGQYIESASFSPDGSYIATAGEIGQVGTNEEIKLWDSQLSESRGSIHTNHTKILSISFTHDGKYIATAGDNVVRIWKAKPDKIGTPILEIEAGAVVKKVSFSQWKGLELIAAVGNDKIVRVWQFSPDTDNPKPNPTYKLLTELNGHEQEISTLAFTQKEPYYLATAGKGTKILIWKFSYQKQIIVTQPEYMGALKSIHVGFVNDSNEKRRLVTLREDNKADIWDLDSKTSNPNNTKNAEDLQEVANISLNSKNNKFAVIKTDGTQEIYDFSGIQEYKKNTDPQKQVTTATFVPNQDVLARGRKDGQVDFWNLIGGDDTPELYTGFNREITSLNYSSDGNYLATMTKNRAVRVFQFSANRKWEQFTWDNAPKNAVISFIPKSKYIITGEENSHLSLWEVVNNKIQEIDIQQWKPSNHIEKIVKVISSPDGNYIASLDANGEAKLWHLSIDKKKKPSVEEIDRQNSGVAKITTLTFSPSYEFGQLMAAGDEKGTIYVWDMKGQKIAEFKPEGEESKVTHITFSRKTNSDNFIVAAYNNGTVRSWEVAGLNDLLKDGCDWLNGYFSSHPNSLLPVCKQLGLTQLAQ